MNGCLYDSALALLERYTFLGEERRTLIGRARGKTLEIGAGTGLNFAHYQSGIELTALEPDEGMRHRMLKKPFVCRIQPQDGDAQKLPFSDETFDTVVGTFVLCTIHDPQKALHEAWRVLKPAGHLLLLEHIRSPHKLIILAQEFLNPLWKHLASGCHLNRDPSRWFESSGFQVKESQSFWNHCGKTWILEKHQRAQP